MPPDSATIEQPAPAAPAVEYARDVYEPLHSRRDYGDLLTLSFGTTVGMWAIGYLGRMPGVQAPSWLLFFLMLAAVLGGGLATGRLTDRGWVGGLLVGLGVGLLNLLILGSLLGGAAANELHPAAALYIPGWLAAAMAAGAIGASIGGALPGDRETPRNWRAAFAFVAVGSTALLLAAGGVVTGFEAGLAVPDWPGSFGYNMFLYPLSRMTGGIYYEHAHRLFGALVGLTTLCLAVYLQFVERRRWVRWAALVALLLVIVQGVLGGRRVTDKRIALAIVHGVLAQLFFTYLTALAIFCSTTWRTAGRPRFAPAAQTDRSLAAVLLTLLVMQLVLGALVRHVVWGLYLHITLAIVVAALVVTFGGRSWAYYERLPTVPRLGAWIVMVVLAQLMLGFASFVAVGDGSAPQTATAVQVAITTAHQTLGAILLASTAALALLQRRLTTPAPA